MEEKKQDVYEIDLLQLAGILLRRWWLIVLTSVVCAALAFIYTFQFVTPMYKTSVMLYVNNSSLSVGSAKLNLSAGDLTARQELVQTYGVILKANLTLQDIEETLSGNQNLHNTYTYKQLDQMISSDAAEGTEIMEITVTCPDYSDAVIIADTVAQVLPMRIARIVEGTSVKVVDLAEYPTAPSSPSYPKNCLIGFLIGLVLSAGAILVYDLLIQDTIDGDDWLRRTYGERIPVLAIVPEIGMQKRGYYYNYDKYYSRYGYESDKAGDSEEEKPLEKNDGILSKLTSSEVFTKIKNIIRKKESSNDNSGKTLKPNSDDAKASRSDSESFAKTWPAAHDLSKDNASEDKTTEKGGEQ